MKRRADNWTAFIAGMGSVIDLGATAACPHCGAELERALLEPELDEEVVVDDWNVIADDFNRTARTEQRRHRS